MNQKTKTATNKRRTLRVFLDDVIRRAKHNTHVGVARSIDLENELIRIHKMVDQTLSDINREAQKDPSPDKQAKVSAKLEQTTELLTSELMSLSAIYHRQVDTVQIRRFLFQQQEIIRASIDDGKEASVTLDDRIADLRSMMAQERTRVSRNERKEQVKFSISLSIALVSLSVSIYALWLR